MEKEELLQLIDKLDFEKFKFYITIDLDNNIVNYIKKDKIEKDLKDFEEIEKAFRFINNESVAREKNKILIDYCKKILKEY